MPFGMKAKHLVGRLSNGLWQTWKVSVHSVSPSFVSVSWARLANGMNQWL